MEIQDYYRTLGVARTASQAEIKKAFRKLARENHPDRNPGDVAAERRFKAINEANEVLSDPEKRAKYDRFGRDWEAYARAGSAGRGGADPFGPGGPFAGYSGFGGPGGNVRYEFRTGGDAGGFSEFFRMMFGQEAEAGRAGGSQSRDRGAGGGPAMGGDLDEILSGMGFRPGTGARAGGRASGRGREPGVVEAAAELSLEETFHGSTRIVEVGGKRLEVTIPRGVDSGSRIRLSGKGPDGRDLVVVCEVRPHGVFTRRGADLEREIPVTLQEALLGGEVPVGTLKGRVILTLPAGTQNGKTFRLSKQGMPRLKRDEPGDLYVRIKVVLPTHLDEKAETAARRFLELAAQPDPRS
jgi:DnaJ-class molecular chaperone